MDRLDARNQGLKMCLDHSQSGIEESLLEVEWSKLMEHLVSFRWTLDQHFTRVAGEGYLENVASLRPGLYSDLREIECHQCRLIDLLDTLIHDVQTYDPQRDEIADMSERFRDLHREILVEENQERLLIERGLA